PLTIFGHAAIFLRPVSERPAGASPQVLLERDGRPHRVRSDRQFGQRTSHATGGDHQGRDLRRTYRRHRRRPIALNLLTAIAPASLRAFDPGAVSAATTAGRSAS